MSDDNDGALSRRDVLAAMAGLGVGGAAAAGVAQTTAALPQGQIGTANDPLLTAYLSEIRGPIVEQGDSISQLVETVAVEEGASINPDTETLVFRYDPDTII